jgi:hypothetical protein
VLTAYTTLHVIGVLIASTILDDIGTKRNYQRRRRMVPLYPRCPLLRLQAHDEVWHQVQAYV